MKDAFGTVFSDRPKNQHFDKMNFRRVYRKFCSHKMQTDDIAALGKEKAEEYYKLASESGYVDNPAPGWQSISQDKAKEMMLKL